MLNFKNAYFTGNDEFPVLHEQSKYFKRPFQMIRFSDRKNASLNDAVCFYEWDQKFIHQLEENQLDKLILDFKRAGSVVQPDYSIFADDPLILQKMAVFNRNRVAYELQSCGIEVIPNLRWGDKRSFEFALYKKTSASSNRLSLALLKCFIGLVGRIFINKSKILI